MTTNWKVLTGKCHYQFKNLKLDDALPQLKSFIPGSAKESGGFEIAVKLSMLKIWDWNKF